MNEKVMDSDTVCLLQECDAGCKMATESMEQIAKYVSNGELSDVITKYNKEHIRLGEEAHQLLNSAGEESKEPNPMAKAFSWFSSQMKMMIKGDAHQAASILIDGCNMGIKTLSEHKNQCRNADAKSVALCEKLQKVEKEMMEELQAFV